MQKLREASDMTKGLDRYAGEYVQIGYDTEDGEVLYDFFISFGMNNWVTYASSSIITIGNFDHYVSQKKLAEIINAELELRDNYKNPQTESFESMTLYN